MAATASEAHGGGGHATTTGLSNNKLGMWLFLGSECLLFGGLISTYMLYQNRTQNGPTPRPDLRHPLHLGQLVRAAHELADDGAGGVRGQRTATSAARACGCARPPPLGSLFVGGQVYEFTAFFREGMGFTTSLFGSQLLHAHRLPRRPRERRHHHADVARRDHVPRPHRPSNRSEVIEIVGLYWHFVDIVWILIFTLVYLIPA